MKRLLWLLLLAAPFAYAQETPIYCISATQTQCSQSSEVGNGHQGDPAYNAYGKLNAWGLQLGLFSNGTANEVLATPSSVSGIPGLRFLVGADMPPVNLAGGNQNGGVTGILPIADGGTGTATPGLVAGTNITISGSWPNQTINSSGGSMVYPAAGIPQSNGSAWGSSITPGTGVVTALGVNVGSAGAFLVNGGALGTPSSGNGSNITNVNAASVLGFTLPCTVPALVSGEYLTNNGSTCSWAAVSGSGTINAAAQYALPYYSAAGSATTLSGLASPTSGAGYYTLQFDPTSATAVAPTLDQIGAATVSISGATSTYTVPYSTVNGMIVHDKAGSAAVTVTLPTPTTLNNAHFATNYCNNSTYTDTIQPTTYTISLNNGTAGASISIASGVCVSIVTDPFNTTQWDAFTYGVPGAVNLAASGPGGITGTLPVANGGTGGTGYTFPTSPATITQTIASGTATLNTATIAPGNCEALVTVSASGVTTGDVVKTGFSGSPLGVAGYSVTLGEVVTIYGYPTANNVNIAVCSSMYNTVSITPGALTVNWSVTR